jgi:hypothetical protein
MMAPSKQRRTTIVVSAETMRRIEHMAVEVTVPMTRALEALLELALADDDLMAKAPERAVLIEAEYRSGVR